MIRKITSLNEISSNKLKCISGGDYPFTYNPPTQYPPMSIIPTFPPGNHMVAPLFDVTPSIQAGPGLIVNPYSGDVNGATVQIAVKIGT